MNRCIINSATTGVTHCGRSFPRFAAGYEAEVSAHRATCPACRAAFIASVQRDVAAYAAGALAESAYQLAGRIGLELVYRARATTTIDVYHGSRLLASYGSTAAAVASFAIAVASYTGGAA